MPQKGSSATKRADPGSTGETADAKRPLAWSVQDVAAWLKQLSLGHLAERFRENGVDGEFLSELSLGDLVTELGATPLQARKLEASFFNN